MMDPNYTGDRPDNPQYDDRVRSGRSLAGEKGGNATKRNMPPDFYARIGRKGGAAGKRCKKCNKTLSPTER